MCLCRVGGVVSVSPRSPFSDVSTFACLLVTAASTSASPQCLLVQTSDAVPTCSSAFSISADAKPISIIFGFRWRWVSVDASRSRAGKIRSNCPFPSHFHKHKGQGHSLNRERAISPDNFPTVCPATDLTTKSCPSRITFLTISVAGSASPTATLIFTSVSWYESAIFRDGLSLSVAVVLHYRQRWLANPRRVG